MKNLLSTLLIVLTIAFGALAQPSIEWQKSYGGTQYDDAYSIQQTSDGGYIVAGASISNDSDITNNHGFADYWIVKLKNNGDLDWQKSYGGTGYEQARSVQQTTDGGYIVSGYSESMNGDVTGNHGGYDAWILKIDDAGIIEWQKSLGGSVDDGANSVQQTIDGGYVVVGYSNSTDGDVTGIHGSYDLWVVKLNSSGSIIEWRKCLGGTQDDEGYSIQQTTDSGFVVAGYTRSNDGDVTGNQGDYDYWVVKLNSTGSLIECQKCLGGTGFDYAYSVQQTSDSGYIVAGQSPSNNGDVTGNHGGDDYWIVKLNNAGNTIEWQKSLGGTSDDVAKCIEQTTDGGYIIAGRSQSSDGNVTGNHGDWDYWIVKLNGAGVMEWQKCLGGTAYDAALSIQQDIDGGYIAAGFASSTDGDVSLQIGVEDYWIVKLNPVINDVVDLSSKNDFSISPNPANEFLVIENPNSENENSIVKIIDVTGREIFSSKFYTSGIKLQTSDFSDGIYFCQLKSNDKIFNQKFIVQH